MVMLHHEMFKWEGRPVGLEPRIIDGLRNKEDQITKFNTGASLAAPGFSYHGYGLACHLEWYNTITKKMEYEAFDLFKKAQEIGTKIGLHTGLQWKNSKGQLVIDWLHFELHAAPISEIKAQCELLDGDRDALFDWVTERHLVANLA